MIPAMIGVMALRYDEYAHTHPLIPQDLPRVSPAANLQVSGRSLRAAPAAPLYVTSQSAAA